MKDRLTYVFVAGFAVAWIAGGASAAAQAPPMPTLPRPVPTVTSGESAEPEASRNETRPPRETWEERIRKPFKVPKGMTVPAGKNRVRMTMYMNDVVEVVGEEGEFLIVRQLDPSDPESSFHDAWLRRQAQEARHLLVLEKLRDKYVITEEPDIFPPFTDRLTFVRRDEGLPVKGKWQMSLDVADMNGDGRPDLILPPVRTGQAVPSVYFQQEDGSWRLARTTWPSPDDAKLDYGAVRVADFDGDGNLDIAIACHFASSYILYGNGAGDFSRSVRLPLAAEGVTSRSLAVADVNDDGRPDVVLFAEVDLEMATSQTIGSGLVNVVLNLPGGWQAGSADAFTPDIHGDDFTVTDLNGDGYPDLVLTTRKQNQRKLLWINDGDGRNWHVIDENAMPINSFVLSSAEGTFGGRPGVVLCFEQFSPYTRTDPPSQACGIFDVQAKDGALAAKPEVTLFYKRDEEFNNVKALSVGDVDGDGRDDVVAADANGNLYVYLQFPDGTLYLERSPELSAGGMDVFDVRVADLDGDGRGEIIVMGAARDEAEGGVLVFTSKPLGA